MICVTLVMARNMAARSFALGSPTKSTLSSLPGRNTAGSIISVNRIITMIMYDENDYK